MEISPQDFHHLLRNSEIMTVLKTAKYWAFSDIPKSIHNLTHYVIIIKMIL